MITLSQAEQIVLTYNANEAILERYGETHLARDKTKEHDWGWVFTFEGSGDEWQDIVRKRGMLRYVVDRKSGLMRSVGSVGLRMTITCLLYDAENAGRQDEEDE